MGLSEDLLTRLREEKAARLKGGLYHATQVAFCYNSNRIEGSRLSEEQTRLIYETNTLVIEKNEPTGVDDIIETVNHFACFDLLLDVAERPLTEALVKRFHAVLKRGTSDSRRDWFRVGGYKKLPNVVGGRETTPPRQVARAVKTLLATYAAKPDATFHDMVDFHWRFEDIHPFQDGNGRVGRLIAFKECLRHGIVPFIIDERHKAFYYRGLSRYPNTPDFLFETCRSAQDRYTETVRFFTGENVGHVR
jgi:Fic family protein